MTTRGYTKVWRSIHRNTALTLAERVLLTEIMSWEFPKGVRPTTKAELARNTGLSAKTVWQLLKKLEEDGFVTMEPQPKRKALFRVTEQARSGAITERLSTTSGSTEKQTLVLPQVVHTITSGSTDHYLRKYKAPTLINTGASQSNPKNSLRTLKNCSVTAPKVTLLPPKPKKPKKPTDPRIKRCIDHFFDEHQRLLNDKYHVKGAADATAVQRLLKTYDEDDLKRRITAFLTEADPWLRSRGLLRITALEKHVEKYSASVSDDDTPRSAEESLARMYGPDMARRLLQEHDNE
jgi:DNA-binding MarR family transcriptional regulator